MEINFTPEAERQLDVIRDVDTIKNGFVMGQLIGKHYIIEGFFPANFNEKNISDLYYKFFTKVGEKLMGVFFNNREPFLNDWFLEDVIIKINFFNKHQHQQPEFYLYDSEKNVVSLNLCER
jgi:hypothetical protein